MLEGFADFGAGGGAELDVMLVEGGYAELREEEESDGEVVVDDLSRRVTELADRAHDLV